MSHRPAVSIARRAACSETPGVLTTLARHADILPAGPAVPPVRCPPSGSTPMLGGWCFEWRTVFHHKDRDFRESDLVGRSPKVAQRLSLAVPVLTDFATAHETAVRHQPPRPASPESRLPQRAEDHKSSTPICHRSCAVRQADSALRQEVCSARAPGNSQTRLRARENRSSCGGGPLGGGGSGTAVPSTTWTTTPLCRSRLRVRAGSSARSTRVPGSRRWSAGPGRCARSRAWPMRRRSLR